MGVLAVGRVERGRGGRGGADGRLALTVQEVVDEELGVNGVGDGVADAQVSDLLVPEIEFQGVLNWLASRPLLVTTKSGFLLSRSRSASVSWE